MACSSKAKKMNTAQFPLRRSRTFLAAALGALLATTATLPVLAQDAQMTVSAASYGGTRQVELELNKSMILDLPAGVAEVIVSQPEVAAAIMRSRTRAIIQGVTGGDTNIFFLDDNGRTIQVLDMRVIEEPSQVGNALQAALARVIPDSRIIVESVTLGDTNRVVLTGTVPSAEDRDRALAIATQFAGGPDNVANIVDVSGAQQVMLQVTISEIRRDAAKQLGINLSGTATLGNASLGFNAGTPALPPGAAGSNGGAAAFPLGSFDIQASITALEERGVARLLAQPTLTAMSGATADFHVGGEFLRSLGIDPQTGLPIQTPVNYGILLDFTPTVRSNGNIGLVMNTEVSEPISNLAKTTRNASTTIELPPGTTLAIGGLLSQQSSRALEQIPGIGNIPILGALFRSNEYQSQQTELVILVTPYLVNPSPVNTIPLPTDEAVISSDTEAVFLGALERRYGVGETGEFRAGYTYSGSVGFMLD
jgi:pilus assembly protein CpaC